MRCASLLLVFAVPVLFAGCDRLGGDDAICTREAKSAVSVQAYDAVTRAALSGYRVTVRDGSFTETLDVADNPFSARADLATERAGQYVVTVEKAGYASWSRAEVNAEEGECHVVTVALDAYLSPIGAGPSVR